MNINRRDLFKSTGVSLLVFITQSYLWKGIAFAGQFVSNRFSRIRSGENLFMAFNNIKDAENGESDEFTTIRNINDILNQMNIRNGTTIIGIGARTGSPNDPYGSPGEMGYLWKKGDTWTGKVTSIKDAHPVPLLIDDPIIVTQVGVLYENTAHHFEINDPSLEGSVLWTLYHDETGSPQLGVGMHNLFSDVDGGRLSMIYQSSKAALKNPQGWGDEKDRKNLQKFIPNLSDDRIWENFSQTLGAPFVHSRWLPYVKQQGWAGAAVVLRGSMENVGQFHITDWIRKSPAEPEFEIGKGTHGPLKIRAGREARPFMTFTDKAWTMVGFIWDLPSKTSNPSMSTYRDFADIFGQDFHIHGFSDDQKVGGHTLFAQLGAGKLSVSLYPLSFEHDETAFLFNNDLMIVKEVISQKSDGLTVRIYNGGHNFVRNVSVRLDRKNLIHGTYGEAEDILIPQLKPGESKDIIFKGKTALNSRSNRRLVLDRDGHFIEGGWQTANNKVEF